MAYINWGNAIDLDGDGVSVAVAMNDKGVVVEVHESQGLCYRVGVRSNGNTIHWGSSTQYDSGQTPKVAINNNGDVVEVHQAELGSNLRYHVGKIDVANQTIEWGRSTYYADGVTPAVAINDKGTVIEVHKTNSQLSHTLWYHTGLIKAQDKTISFNNSYQYDSGESPAVALNNNGSVVEVHCTQSLVSHTLWYHCGMLNGKKISFHKSVCYDHGVHPTIALSDSDQVVEAHQSQGVSSELWFNEGKLAADGTELILEPKYSVAFDNGGYPSVAVNNKSQFVEMHRILGLNSVLCYHSTQKFPRGNYRTWINDNYETLKTKYLYEITLPGTHDTGTYTLGRIPEPGLSPVVAWIQKHVPALLNSLIHDWSITQSQNIADQLNGGIRFFDLRIAKHESDFYIHHGLLGPKVTTVFQQIERFMCNVERELVIISASHMEGMDDESHEHFIGLIMNYLGSFLYKRNPGVKSLRNIQIEAILKEGPKVIFIYDDKYFAKVAHFNEHLWPSDVIYSHWSNTDSIEKLISTQQKEIDNYSDCKSLFELQWILTDQVMSDIVPAAEHKAVGLYAPTLHTLSQAPNQWLRYFLNENVKKSPHINIIIVDFYEESEVVEMCVKLSVNRTV